MKSIKILLALLLLVSVSFAQTYQIDWYVISSGGGHAESGAYEMDATVGQPIVGQSSSSSYILESGFWVGAGLSSIQNEYVPGDANMINGQWPPLIIGGDVTYLVGYFRGLNPPCLINGFYCSGDANGDCQVIGSDVTKMVTYFRGMTSLSYCADYPAAWPTPGDCPEDAPAGWPGCETPPVLGDKAAGGDQKSN
jgi:hypothetical protein